MSNELKYYDRQRLEYWLRTKQSLRKIAQLMHRGHSVVVREIQRNSSGRKKYRADTAQRLCEKRKHKQHRGKLNKYPKLRAYVEEKIVEDWSPEQIAGRLKQHQPQELRGLGISHESIYYWIYEKSEKYKKLHTHLRTHRKKRRGHGKRKRGQKVNIPGRTSIRERPDVVNQKKRVGDWESDTMEGTKRDGVCISAQYERKTMATKLHKIQNTSAEETYRAIVKTIDSLPLHMIKTCTFDNGTETTKHMRVTEEYGIDTYHCDPYSPWQKGGVENAIKLVRQYIPKKTPISKVTESEISFIEARLNNRPRKGLNYQTPNEVIQESGALKP
jgi:transposase, IS30 family